MKTLVTGATGFLGRHVVDLLVARGEAVRVLVRRPHAALGRLPGVEQVEGDVLDEASVRAAMGGVGRVHHLAGVVSRDPDDATQMMRVHVDGTRHVLAAARAAGVERIVLASSSGTSAVPPTPDVHDEDSPYATDVVKGWPYYLSKIYQERLALERHVAEGVPVVVLCPSLLLGPGDARGSSTDDVRRFLERKIPVIPSGGLSYVDARDAAAAFLAAMERGRVGERYLLGGPNWTFATFFGRLERIAKVAGPRLRLPDRWARLGASALEELARFRGAPVTIDRISVEMAQSFWYVDSRKAERELGFVARDPQETLVDTVRYVRRHFLGEERRSLGA